MSHLWVIVVNYNGLADTRICLESLAKIPPEGVRVLVVDNGSSPDPTAELRQDFPWVEVLRRPTNEGWAGGNNRGIEYALEHHAHSVLLLNNDATLHPESIDRLNAAASAHPEYGLLGPVVRDFDPPNAVQTDGFVFGDPGYDGFWSRRPVTLARTAPPTVVPTDVIVGCCLLIRAEVFRTVGFIDERFFLIHEESDFCLRSAALGFRVGILAEDLAWHRGSATFAASGKPWQRYYDARNLWLLLSKHRPRPHRDRSRFQSRWTYFRHMYYYWSEAVAASKTDAAEAILAGVSDGWSGRFGPFFDRPRPLVFFLRLLFRFRRLIAKVREGFRKG